MKVLIKLVSMERFQNTEKKKKRKKPGNNEGVVKVEGSRVTSIRKYMYFSPGYGRS